MKTPPLLFPHPLSSIPIPLYHLQTSLRSNGQSELQEFFQWVDYVIIVFSIVVIVSWLFLCRERPVFPKSYHTFLSSMTQTPKSSTCAIGLDFRRIPPLRDSRFFLIQESEKGGERAESWSGKIEVTWLRGRSRRGSPCHVFQQVFTRRTIPVPLSPDWNDGVTFRSRGHRTVTSTLLVSFTNGTPKRRVSSGRGSVNLPPL